jgi:asparagine synthase (glutamine-hydrolysing)
LLRDIDAVSMSHSLEVRVPYLDPVIADIALSLPDETKLGNLSDFSNFLKPSPVRIGPLAPNVFLLDIGKKHLHADFDLTRKRGFGMPFGDWLRGPLVDVLEILCQPMRRDSVACSIPPRSQQSRAIFRIAAGPWYKSWLLMMLELWSREILDRSSVSGWYLFHINHALR